VDPAYAVWAMNVGLVREIKASEGRVALTPAGTEILVARGHQVLVEMGAGVGSGWSDDAYRRVGASLVEGPEAVFSAAHMIVKVKEPLPEEHGLIRENQILFTFFHFAASDQMTRAILGTRCVAIAYETMRDAQGGLPLLRPMSEIAGRLAVQQGAMCLEQVHGGRGLLLSGVPGVEPAVVVVFGAGTVGSNAARIASGFGARVYLMDVSIDRLRHLDEIMPANVVTLVSNPDSRRKALAEADVVISSVLLPGSRSPKIITREDLRVMKDGAALIDVAIDQGGSAESSRPTTHRDPIYVEQGVVHYCVANMPGAVPVTSTAALTNATLPYIVKIADLGWREAARRDATVASGINLVSGRIVCREVAEALGVQADPLPESI